VVTVIDGVVSPVLHSSVPADVVDSVELPLHPFTTVTGGATGGAPTVNTPFW